MKLDSLEERLSQVVPDNTNATASGVITIPGPCLQLHALKNLRIARLDEGDYEGLTYDPHEELETVARSIAQSI